MFVIHAKVNRLAVLWPTSAVNGSICVVISNSNPAGGGGDS